MHRTTLKPKTVEQVCFDAGFNYASAICHAKKDKRIGHHFWIGFFACEAFDAAHTCPKDFAAGTRMAISICGRNAK